jgi:hypothetical protein
MPIPPFSGTFATTNLAETLRMLVQAKQTGILYIHHGAEEGILALENGMIINAKTALHSGMHALFEFVGWHEAHFEFKEKPLPPDFSRDLSVYDAGVLIAGVAAKVAAGATI